MQIARPRLPLGLPASVQLSCRRIGRRWRSPLGMQCNWRLPCSILKHGLSRVLTSLSSLVNPALPEPLAGWRPSPAAVADRGGLTPRVLAPLCQAPTTFAGAGLDRKRNLCIIRNHQSVGYPSDGRFFFPSLWNRRFFPSFWKTCLYSGLWRSQVSRSIATSSLAPCRM